jgi:diguanylate cyclase (GGDEF)-like protein/PAS domain S-box-containing protein
MRILCGPAAGSLAVCARIGCNASRSAPRRISRMIIAPMPDNEAARLEALSRYRVFDLGPVKALDDLTRLAAQVCLAPIALLSIVAGDRLLHKARAGAGSELIGTDRRSSFCSWAILGRDTFVVTDASLDARFNSSPLVAAQPGIRFYAGVPLITPEGHALGTLSVIDVKPRRLGHSEEEALRTLAAAAMAHLELRRRSFELEEAQHYNLIARNANDGFWDWNLETNKILLCPRWKKLFGYQENEIGTHPDEWFKRIHPEDVELVQSEIMSHLLGLSPHFQSEHRVRNRDGTYRWVLSRGLAVWGADRSVYRMSGSVIDITERKKAEEDLLHNALHDNLTGLPNRTLFMDRLKRALERAKHCRDSLFAVLFLDLDRFKAINDSFGHQVGDEVLLAVARKLEASLRPGDMVARLSGDEFAIILDRLRHVSDATAAAERIQKELAAPLKLGGQEVFVSASIGIAISLSADDLPDDLLRNADVAMYRAKRQGRGHFQLFDESLRESTAENLQLESDLRWGLLRNEFRVYYQPIISLDSWRITGFEALLRWHHPELGFVPPLKFIPVAEETGLIVEIGRWVLREACRQLRTWQDEFPSDPPLTVSVNLSGKQFSQPDLIDTIRQVLRETGLSAGSLKIEVTESAIIENIDSAAAILKQLKELGIRISLDDFGTGYSSLSYLHRFPIDTLKIDRSFIARMNLPKDSEIVRTIVTLANNLGMDVIAEGVETREQVIQLTGLNCEYVQGYLLSQPIDSEAMRNLIEETGYKVAGQQVAAPQDRLYSPV